MAVKEDRTLIKSNIPYVENFPRNVKFPAYIPKCLKRYGNTVISNKLLKKIGWNGLQWYCSQYGLKVTVIKTAYNNCIVEVIKRAD